MADGWMKLGSALGGNSELEYQKGLQLGAQTENALAEARKRVDENAARMELDGSLQAMGFTPEQSRAASTTLRAGGNLGDAFSAMLKSQEHGFRATAGDPNSTPEAANAALRGVASGPVERYYNVGSGGYADKFADTGVMPLGDAAGGGGGEADRVQWAKYVLGLDEATRDKALLYDKNVQGIRNVGETPTYFAPGRGVQPSLVPNAAPIAPGAAPGASGQTFAPPAAGPGVVQPMVTNAMVNQNLAEAERAKVIGRESGQAFAGLAQGRAKVRNQTTMADSVIAEVDRALGDTNWWSAGPAGMAMRGLAFTDAGQLQRSVDMIKANIGFQQLQQMRAENLTGAGLGQIAVQELGYLQASLANLDTAQDPDQLARALQNVRTRFSMFKTALAEDLAAQTELAGVGNPMQAPAAPVAPGAAPAASGAISLDEYLRGKGH